MSAFFIAIPRQLTQDREVMRPYQEQVEASMAPYGGRYRTLLHHRIEELEGSGVAPKGIVIVEFPTFEQGLAWYHPPKYAPLLAIRQTHEQFDAFLVDGLEDGVTLLSLIQSVASPSRVGTFGSSDAALFKAGGQPRWNAGAVR